MEKDDSSFNDEQIKEAQTFTDFYTDLIEHSMNCVKYYLSDDVVLDWFGQTVKGEKNAGNFLKSNVSNVKHYMTNVKPAEKIGFRDSHNVKISRESKRVLFNFRSPLRSQEPKTPPRQTQQPSTSAPSVQTPTTTEKSQSDSFQNNTDVQSSPAKKFRPTIELANFNEADTIECETENELKLKYLTAEGSVQFHRPSIKKLQTETKWMRPCKLSIAYTSTNNKDYTIYLVIYEGTVKCRRNLMKDFAKEEAK